MDNAALVVLLRNGACCTGGTINIEGGLLLYPGSQIQAKELALKCAPD
jgi:hypothetical protein